MHGQVTSMVMTCLSDGEYLKMLGQSMVRAICIGNTSFFLTSATTFQSLTKNKIPDLPVVLFNLGVPDFTK